MHPQCSWAIVFASKAFGPAWCSQNVSDRDFPWLRWSTANPGRFGFAVPLIGLAAVVPTVFVLMPPATARSFAFPTPHAGTAFRTRRPARNALLAAYVVPSAIVAATVVGSYRRRDAFCCGSVSSRPDRRRQRRPGGKNAHPEESKSCIENSVPISTVDSSNDGLAPDVP